MICSSGNCAHVLQNARAHTPAHREYCSARFPQAFQSAGAVQSRVQKDCYSVFRKYVICSAHPAPTRGAFRDRHEREVGCGGPRRGVRRALAVADGEAVWFWRPLAGVKFATAPTRRADDGVNTAIGPREERGVRRQTIAWGMPDVSGASAVNTGAHTLRPGSKRASGCGCIGHPAFPAPSFRGATRNCKLGRIPRRETAKACLFSKEGLPVFQSFTFPQPALHVA